MDVTFEQLVGPHRNEIRLHCYRMLGSSSDGDDMIQETLLRAWRAHGSLTDPASVRPWLYKIATNVCLDELRRRPGRVHTSSAYPPADPLENPAPPPEEATWLEPLPDTWLAGATPEQPGARLELKESVALAFVAALQLLTPPQRAVLLLRDVVGLPAEATAEALGLTVSAANSALHRARVAMDGRVGDPSSYAGRVGEVDRDLLARYVRVWEQADIAGLMDLLHEEVTVTMPPSPTWLLGRTAAMAFLRQHVFSWLRPGRLRLRALAANGQPAFAFYRTPPEGGRHELEAIHVLTTGNGRVRAFDHFLLPRLAPVFGLPAALSDGDAV